MSRAVQLHIAGNDLVFLIFVKIFFQRFLIKRHEMHPQDALAVKGRIFFGYPPRESRQIRSSLVSHHQVRPHHEIQVADEFPQDTSDPSAAGKTVQQISCLVFRADDLF